MNTSSKIPPKEFTTADLTKVGVDIVSPCQLAICLFALLTAGCRGMAPSVAVTKGTPKGAPAATANLPVTVVVFPLITPAAATGMPTTPTGVHVVTSASGQMTPSVPAMTSAPTTATPPLMTSLPTSTAIASLKPGETPATGLSALWGNVSSRQDVSVEQSLAGVTVRIKGIGFASRSAFPPLPNAGKIGPDVSTFGLIDVEVENASQQTVQVFPDKGVVSVGSETIQLQFRGLSEAIGGELPPGGHRLGTIVFGLKSADPKATGALTYIISPPIDMNYDRLADQDYSFHIPLKG